MGTEVQATPINKPTLEGMLRPQELDSARIKRVGECLGSCTDCLSDLGSTLKDIRLSK